MAIDYPEKDSPITEQEIEAFVNDLNTHPHWAETPNPLLVPIEGRANCYNHMVNGRYVGTVVHEGPGGVWEYRSANFCIARAFPTKIQLIEWITHNITTPN